MSLFALRRDYQRSFNKIFEDLSVHSQQQTETLSLAQMESKMHGNVIPLDDASQSRKPSHIKNTVSEEASGEYQFIQNDLKAWGRFLDSTKKE